MRFYERNELDDFGEDHQEPGGNQGLLDAQFFGAHEEELPFFSPRSASSPIVLFPNNPEEVAAAVAPSPPRSPESSCPSPSAMEAIPWSQSEDEGSSSQDEEGPSPAEVPQGVLRLKMTRLLFFLLAKYRAKEPTSKAEMLSVITEHQDHFNEIFTSTSQCLQLVFGVDVREVDPINHIYVLGATLGLTYHEVASDGHSMPKTGLLILLLCVIVGEGDSASEEKVWKVLNHIGVHEGCEHHIYGEPRELITKVWVKEQYLVYRQVADSDPARYEFLWGPRAHAETTRLRVLHFLFSHTATYAGYAPSQS